MTEGRFSQQVVEALTLPTRAGTNWVTNPSLETNTTFWTLATSTISRVNEDAWTGGWSLKCVATGTGAGGALIGVDPTNGYPFVGGEIVSAKVRMKSVQVGKALLFHLGFRNAANSQLAIVTQRIIADGTWQELSHQQITAPALTHHVYMQCYWETAAVNDVLYIDGADFRVNEPGCDSYIDGSLGAGYAWTGVAHATPSLRAQTMAPSIRSGKNWITNPSAEVNTAGMGASGGTTLTQSNEQAWVGAWSYKAVRLTPASGSLFSYALTLTGITLTGVAHLLIWKVRYWAAAGAAHNGRLQINVIYTTGSLESPTLNLPAPTGTWQEATLSWTTDPARTITNINLYPYVANVVEATTAYFDGIELRIDEPDIDTYIDGSLGPGYSWSGTAHASSSVRAAMVPSPRAAKNWLINPSFEVNAGSWQLANGAAMTRVATQALYGAWSGQLTLAVTANSQTFIGISTTGLTLTGVTHTVNGKVWLWIPTGTTLDQVYLQITYTDNSSPQSIASTIVGTSAWQAVTPPAMTSDPAKTIANVYLVIRKTSAATGYTIFVDGADIRIDEPDADTYVDGSLGPGYVWTGAVHGSASTRAAPWSGALPLTEPALQSSQLVAEVGTLLSSAVAAQLSQVVLEVAIAAPPVSRTQIVTIG